MQNLILGHGAGQGPFIIFHNYRQRQKMSEEGLEGVQKHKRQLHDYSLDRKSIILTRKMKARLEQGESEG